jgi:CheY-like chemotaxis protein
MIRVLYVDDEEALLELAKIFLEESHEILLETASDAPTGLKRVLVGDIDAVVSDAGHGRSRFSSVAQGVRQ